MKHTPHCTPIETLRASRPWLTSFNQAFIWAYQNSIRACGGIDQNTGKRWNCDSPEFHTPPVITTEAGQWTDAVFS